MNTFLVGLVVLLGIIAMVGAMMSFMWLLTVTPWYVLLIGGIWLLGKITLVVQDK